MKKLLLLGFHPACLRFEKSNLSSEVMTPWYRSISVSNKELLKKKESYPINDNNNTAINLLSKSQLHNKNTTTKK